MHLPRLYAILDPPLFPDADAMFIAGEDLVAAGVTLLQYRNKSGNARQMLEQGQELKLRVSDGVTLIMNDRADLCLAAGFDGLHVGQDDLSPDAARRIIGDSPRKGAASAPEAAANEGEYSARVELVPFPVSVSSAPLPSEETATKRCWLGVSTHNPEQLAEADRTSADYLAIGPVFATFSKANADPVVGLDGVRRARVLTRKPLVAIGGITRANARSVIEAGADSVAVISDLIPDPRKSAEEFLAILR